MPTPVIVSCFDKIGSNTILGFTLDFQLDRGEHDECSDDRGVKLITCNCQYALQRPDVILCKIQAEVQGGRMVGANLESPYSNFQTSILEIVKKEKREF